MEGLQALGLQLVTSVMLSHMFQLARDKKKKSYCELYFHDLYGIV